MSFLQKFVSRFQQRRRLNTSRDADKSLTEDSTKDKKTDGKGNRAERSNSQREVNEKATEPIDKSLKKAQRRLNKQLDTYRSCRLSLEQKQTNLEHLNKEVNVIKIMLEDYEKKILTVDYDRHKRLLEMALVCALVPEEISPELRKKEPLYFKKFKNAKTLEEAQTVLSGIEMKQRALQRLETITFKKILQLENQLPDVSKNNNNNVVDTDMKGYVKDIMERLDRNDFGFGEVSPVMLSWESQSAINNVENLPTYLSFDNPIFESFV